MSLKKKSVKKIKYWPRNGGFKFWPEVKITHVKLTASISITQLVDQYKSCISDGLRY